VSVYEGHGVTLHHADCLDVLRSLPDCSVDSVVTDPPYELGFMGKEWDASGIAYNVDLWRECLRVLKPGGHLLAFGGSRTWHRLAAAIEDAGFEIRDSIAWLYGCHDDRTEVLTRRGWVNGLDLRDDDDVAQWSTDGTVELVRPTARQRYPFDGHMVRFRNADVDQLVTPNHRVYHQTSDRVQVNGKRTASWSPWQVRRAADINRWQPMRLPAAGVHDGPGIGGTDYAALLGWVWTDGRLDLHGTGVRIYQSSTNQPLVDEIDALLDRLGPHKRYDYTRTWKGRPYIATTWFFTGELARRVRADLPGKAPSWDLLWRMTADEKRALWDAAMKGDGSKDARTFWQKDRSALEWAQALLAGIGARGKVADDPRGVLHWQPSATVELQRRHLVDDGEDYTGEVWCVTVPSGAFIVRRNGRVSVSGNSGFPKSLDVAKAITGAQLGHGSNASAIRRATMGEDYTPSGVRGNRDGVTRRSDTGMAGRDLALTPDAEPWQGWGTALKPAFEPIVVARKPLAGTVVANVLAHGTGALNIAACRVGDEVLPAMTAGQARIGTFERGEMVTPERTGRWPANVVLDDATAAELDRQSGTSVSRVGKPRGAANGDGWGMTATGAEYDDQGGASRFFPIFRYEAKAPTAERPRYTRPKLRLRADLTPEQVDHVRARLAEAGVRVD